MRVKYTLSEKGRNAQFVETGKRQFSNQYYIEYDDTDDLTPEQRQIAIEAPQTGVVKQLQLVTLNVKPVTIPDEVKLNRDGSRGRFGVDKPTYAITQIEFDAEPDRDTVFAILQAMAKRVAILQPELEFEQERYDAYKATEAEVSEKARAAYKVEQALLKAKAQRKAEAERQSLLNIEWREDNTAIHNLHDAVFAVSGLEKDRRFCSWIKHIRAVEMTLKNGYCFQGEWINDQTMIVKREPAVFLAAAVSGSRKYNNKHYVVVVMTAEGKLQKTEIATDDTDRGWALRIREQVAALL